MKLPRLLPSFSASLIGLALLIAVPTGSSWSQEQGTAVLIHLDSQKKPHVTVVDESRLKTLGRGLLISLDSAGKERWQMASGEFPSKEAPLVAAALSASPTRGVAGGYSGVGDGLQVTVQLDQIRVTGIGRDLESSFLTPPRGGMLLNPRVTFRRMPGAGDPPTVALLTLPNKTQVRIAFKARELTLPWQSIPQLASKFPAGLAPGKYSLRLEQGGPTTFFNVEPVDEQRAALEPIEKMVKLLGGKREPMGIQFGVETLLARTDDDGLPIYMADALDLLESGVSPPMTPFLQLQHKQLVQWLEKPPQERRQAMSSLPAAGEKTGVTEIDQARDLSAAGDWTRALKMLESAAVEKKARQDKRVKGLVSLYRGAVLAEAGPSRAEEASNCFVEAIADLENQGDKLRAHNNFAEFLQQRAQDWVYNHALQMAAGVERPFQQALQSWITALEHYEISRTLAEKLGRGRDVAAIQINLARLYALLTDIVTTLDADGKFKAGADASAQQAQAWAAQALASSAAEPLTRAAAFELRAQLAFRAKDTVATKKLAEEARAEYLKSGFLVGCENVHRLLALSADSRPEAVKNFQIAHLLSELFRQRMPKDRVGLSRAGFFARKAWVSHRIVELLLEEGDYAQALEFAETSKARALQDLLLAGRGASDEGLAMRTSIASLKQSWPKDVVALEYFLGTEHSWVFLVKTGGAISAHKLHDAGGKPVATQDLIFRIQQFLRNIEGQSAKMYSRIMAGKGFDHTWQDDLSRLYEELIPQPARVELQKAKLVVIVPQHILHYFPFAALVTKKDTKTDAKGMVNPRFLVDEPFTLINAPSLTAWSVLRQQTSRPIRKVNAVGLVHAPGAEPLPGVEEDLKNLKQVFGSKIGTAFEGDAARESNVKKVLAQQGLLFFATHGMNEADRPLHSHLLLLPDSDAKSKDGDANDGQLTAGELFAQTINTDLIVMSACYSGLADRSPMPGDDLFGLQRSFLQSGARTVVSGLWDVYDGSAPELMKSFFEGLTKGHTAPMALAESQRGFLNRLRQTKGVQPWLHPYFWAVYTISGDDRTRLEI